MIMLLQPVCRPLLPPAQAEPTEEATHGYRGWHLCIGAADTSARTASAAQHATPHSRNSCWLRRSPKIECAGMHCEGCSANSNAGAVDCGLVSLLVGPPVPPAMGCALLTRCCSPLRNPQAKCRKRPERSTSAAWKHRGFKHTRVLPGRTWACGFCVSGAQPRRGFSCGLACWWWKKVARRILPIADGHC
jgi:hypothetical protein